MRLVDYSDSSEDEQEEEEEEKHTFWEPTSESEGDAGHVYEDDDADDDGHSHGHGHGDDADGDGDQGDAEDEDDGDGDAELFDNKGDSTVKMSSAAPTSQQPVSPVPPVSTASSSSTPTGSPMTDVDDRVQAARQENADYVFQFDEPARPSFYQGEQVPREETVPGVPQKELHRLAKQQGSASASDALQESEEDDMITDEAAMPTEMPTSDPPIEVAEPTDYISFQYESSNVDARNAGENYRRATFSSSVASPMDIEMDPEQTSHGTVESRANFDTENVMFSFGAPDASNRRTNKNRGAAASRKSGGNRKSTVASRVNIDGMDKEHVTAQAGSFVFGLKPTSGIPLSSGVGEIFTSKNSAASTVGSPFNSDVQHQEAHTQVFSASTNGKGHKMPQSRKDTPGFVFGNGPHSSKTSGPVYSVPPTASTTSRLQSKEPGFSVGLSDLTSRLDRRRKLHSHSSPQSKPQSTSSKSTPAMNHFAPVNGPPKSQFQASPKPFTGVFTSNTRNTPVENGASLPFAKSFSTGDMFSNVEFGTRPSTRSGASIPGEFPGRMGPSAWPQHATSVFSTVDRTNSESSHRTEQNGIPPTTFERGTRPASFSFGVGSKPEPEPSPPVEYLKTDFDGFRIGIHQRTSNNDQRDTTTRSTNHHTPSMRTGGDFNPFTKDTHDESNSQEHSPFGFQSNTGAFTMEDHEDQVHVAAPADPFVLPVYRQNKSKPGLKVKHGGGARHVSTGGRGPSQFPKPNAQSSKVDGAAHVPDTAAPVFVFGTPNGYTTPKQSPGPEASMFVFGSSASAQSATHFSRNVFSTSQNGSSADTDRKKDFVFQRTPTMPTRSCVFPEAPSVAPSGRRILRPVRPTQTRNGKSNSSIGAMDICDGEDTEDEDENDLNQGLRNWGYWKQLGGTAYASRKYQEAADCYLHSIVALERLLSEYPELKTVDQMKDKAKLHSNRAAALMMLMHIQEAQRECVLSVEMDPTYTRAYLRLGRIQVMLGEISGAKENVDIANRLCELDPDAVDQNDIRGVKKIESAIQKLESLQAEIKWCLDVRDFSRALSHLRDALAIAPNCRAFQIEKAKVLFEQKNYSQLEEYCVGIVRKHKLVNGNGNKSAQGDSQHESGERGNTQAAKLRRDAVSLGVELCVLRIKALHHQNKIEDAMQHLAALEIAAPCSESVIQLKRAFLEMKDLKHQANEFFKCGRYELAQQVYSQCLLLDPTHDEFCAVIYCNRAAAFMGLERYKNALLDCDNALRRKAHYPRALLRRARCHVALKNFALAIADFDRYLEEQPQDASSSTKSGVEMERLQARVAMDREVHEKARRETERRKERQDKQRKANPQSTPKPRRQHKNNPRYTWDDNTYFEDYWKEFSSASSNARPRANGAGSSNAQSGGKPNRGGNRSSSHRATTMHAKPPRTHYDLLGIQKTVSQDEIKKAYRRLALQYHPDKTKDTNQAEMFKDMTAAYNVLSDGASRASYDRELQYGWVRQI